MRETMEDFERLMAHFAALGRWRIMRRGSRYFDDILVAKLSGLNGTVEVWGGNLHRREVWFIGRDQSETLIAMECGYRDGTLRDAILQACNLAGIQRRLFEYAC